MGAIGALRSILRGGRPSITLDGPRALGEAASAVVPLIIDLLDAGPMQVRKDSTETYLECIVTREQLDTFAAILCAALGKPVKPFGRSVAFDKRLRVLINSRGGVRKDQCLFLRRYEDDRVVFAALWPWSNPDRITLKVGVYTGQYSAGQ